MTVVLIADDEKALRDSLAETVRDLGYIPVVASSGRDEIAAYEWWERPLPECSSELYTRCEKG